MRLVPIARHLVAEARARYELDLSGMVAGVQGRLESRLLLTPLSLDGDLAQKRLLGGGGRVRTLAFEAERLRKVVLSEIRLWPVIEGFALTLAPRSHVEAPTFGADLMILPARISVNADVYGMPEHMPRLLAPLGDSFRRLGGGPGPAWARPICRGEGLHARVSPRLLAEAVGGLNAALGAFLDALAAAPSTGEGDVPGSDGRAGSHTGDGSARETDEPVADRPRAVEAGQAAFFRLFHEHGPRRGPLRYLCGDAWAERYSRLVFE